MTGFWIAAAVLLLLGYAFFIPALAGKRRADKLSRARMNLLLHQQRQRELERESADPADLDRLAAESERNLLGDLEMAREPALKAVASGRVALIAVLLVLPVLALGTYLALGRPDLLSQPPARPMADLEQSIQRLAERLKRQPDDLEGWVLLGRSLQATRQPDQAVQAYEFALKLAPGNLDLKGLYAEALAEANQGSTLGRPAEIVEEILRKDPNHKGGLWMAGVAAAERQDPARAAEYWERLKAQFPPDSDEARQLDRHIADARGLPPAPESPRPAGGDGSGKRIRVKVALADALKTRAAPDDVLFIFARAAEGPPMPLAVVRKRVRDLPVEVVLDDSMAMMPDRNLSAFERLVIGARVSKTGQPIPSVGDLQGLTEPVTPGKEGSYSIVVDRVVGEN